MRETHLKCEYNLEKVQLYCLMSEILQIKKKITLQQASQLPPQSIAVSSPFCCPSSQVAENKTLFIKCRALTKIFVLEIYFSDQFSATQIVLDYTFQNYAKTI